MFEQKPYVGLTVYYTSFGTPKGEYKSKQIASIITQVNPDKSVGLFIMNPTGVFFNTSVKFDETRQPGTWSFISAEDMG